MVTRLSPTKWLKQILMEDEGAGLAEYALLLFVVAVAAATTITAFGQDIVTAFQEATNSLPAVADSTSSSG